MTDATSNTVVGVFDDRAAAEQAVNALEEAGFRGGEIGFVIRGSDAVQGGMMTDAQGAKDRVGAVAGALTGGMVGGMMAAAIAVMLPGVGPVLAGGVLASFFGGAVAGTAVGGILGALTGLGMSEEEARFYEKAFTSGRALVAVKAGFRRAEATRILQRLGGTLVTGDSVPSIPTQGPFSQP